MFLPRYAAYAADFPLVCLLHDISMAKAFSPLIASSERRKVAVDWFTDGRHHVEAYLRGEETVLQDWCRALQRLPEV